MAELIPVGSTETQFNTGEFTIPAGASVALLIKGAASGGMPKDVVFEIARKTSGGQYTVLLALSHANYKDNAVWSSGSTSMTYAARRLSSGTDAGMDYA